MNIAAFILLAAVARDGEIRSLLDRHKAPAIVVGVVEPGGTRVISRGRANGDTIFEIGSVTKVFTAMLLEDAAARGEVSVADPITRYLPAGVRVPQRNGKAITLEQLAKHTSGLPRLPSNLDPRDIENPYADYSVEQLYAFLSAHELARDPGESEEYSNLGAGLLGHLLARRAESDYETLVRQRILDPLGMRDTMMTLTPKLRKRLAPGHGADLRPVKNWDIPTLAGAGALRSSVNDMLKFVDAALKSPRDLGWQRYGSILWHNGGTGGYASFVAIDRARGRGVVVLSNSARSVDNLGMTLISR